MASQQMKLGWICCNDCHLRISGSEKPFFLTHCGHVFCDTCSTQAEKQCVVCKMIGPRKTPLQEPMLPQITPFFTTMSDSLGLLQRVVNFQDGQFQIVLQRMDEVEKKYEFTQTAYQNITAVVEDMQKKCQEIEAKIKKYTQYNKEAEKKCIIYQDEITKLQSMMHASQSKRSNSRSNQVPVQQPNMFGPIQSSSGTDIACSMPSQYSSGNSKISFNTRIKREGNTVEPKMKIGPRYAGLASVNSSGYSSAFSQPK